MLSKSGQVYGWPHGGYPAPQGPFYCGVGSESVYGRPLAEAHMDACIKVRSCLCQQQLPRTYPIRVLSSHAPHRSYPSRCLSMALLKGPMP